MMLVLYHSFFKMAQQQLSFVPFLFQLLFGVAGNRIIKQHLLRRTLVRFVLISTYNVSSDINK